LEKEENERDAMKELEQKTMDAKTEMAIADALDEVRTRNAQRERGGVEGAMVGVGMAQQQADEERARVEREMEEQAREAFRSGTGEKVRRVVEDEEDEGVGVNGADVEADKKAMPPPPVPAPTFQRAPKKKKDFSAALGIKKKPALV
jgi:hypothetical protein